MIQTQRWWWRFLSATKCMLAKSKSKNIYGSSWSKWKPTQAASFSGSCRPELLQGCKGSLHWGTKSSDGLGMLQTFLVNMVLADLNRIQPVTIWFQHGIWWGYMISEEKHWYESHRTVVPSGQCLAILRGGMCLGRLTSSLEKRWFLNYNLYMLVNIWMIFRTFWTLFRGFKSLHFWMAIGHDSPKTIFRSKKHQN